jgi:hypothetical protein
MARFHSSPGFIGAPLALAAGLIVSACQNDTAGLRVGPEATITVTPAELTLTLGSKATLEATIQDSEGRPLTGRGITWSSSAPHIVAVSPRGVVTALDLGAAMIAAHSLNDTGFARVVVQMELGLPVERGGRWLVLTEMGGPTTECPGNEGGVRLDGGRDCTHAGVSRYSLDFADAEQWEGSLSRSSGPEVFAAAPGTITFVCLHPAPLVACEPNGPLVQVEHPGGFVTIYAHLDPSSITLQRKTSVARGQSLGNMAAFDGDRAPWLHFELRHQDQGARAAAVIEPLLVDGRRFREYQVGELASE